jgi:hypothetical protein
VSDYLAASTLPVQPRNMRELRAWAGVRHVLSVQHASEVCADDDGVEACDKARGYAVTWDEVVEILADAIEVGEALTEISLRHALVAGLLDGRVPSSVDRAYLEARVEAYAEAIATVAAVPGVRA